MAEIAVVALGEDRFGELELLWRELYEHHTALVPHLDDRQLPFERSWERRSRMDREWLRAEPGSFVLVAKDGEQVVGYALVRVRSGEGFAASWRTGHPLGELTTLVVLPAARGRGVGSALLDAVDERLRALGVEDLAIGVITTNVEAMRLYERRGAVPYITCFIQRVPPAAGQTARAGAETSG